MHYKNGREAKQGDLVVYFNGPFSQLGILHSLNGTSESCNGRLAPTSHNDAFINIKDSLHVEDIAAASVPQYQPPIDNAHVAPGCEQFGTVNAPTA